MATVSVAKGEEAVIELIQKEEEREEKNKNELLVLVFKYKAEELSYKKELIHTLARLEKR
ncbi:hypothetical protein KKA27_03830 [Patescibacteria group bacterium]|nr:hypothetical protein [Patescibacteria group bacterium]MBU2633538.1 hypothetical protein [Patescibacteria group bacterium]